jgi:ACS family tartrate transporter-like MFS transporter
MTDERPQTTDIARSAMSKASWRILPLLGIGYLVAYMDRVNIGFAATRMNQDLGFSATIYGLGGGLFFLSYALFEVPSNLLLVRFGARRWIARIMITWGILAVAMMFVRTPLHFYIVRFLLGFAEAGFFPGVVYYLTRWFPMSERGRAVSRFYCAGPAAAVVLGAISGSLMGLEGHAGLHGWQWLFLVEGLPAVVVGVAILFLLPEKPDTASWLTQPEKDWLTGELAADAAKVGEPPSHNILAALRHPLVLQLGLIGFLGIGAFYALTLSAPAVLIAAAGLDVAHAGYVISAGGILGALGMLYSGSLTDRRGDRFGALLVSILLLAVAYLTLALTKSPVMAIAAYLLFAGAWTTCTTTMVLLWTDVVPVRLLAVGCAAINSMNQIGAFICPVLWGVSKDKTGSYNPALIAMSVAMVLMAGLVLVLRKQVNRNRAEATARLSEA